MKTATVICCGIEVLLLIAVVMSYGFGVTVGVIMTVLWSMCCGFILMLGQELDEQPKPLHETKTKEPKYIGSIGSLGITVSTLNPAGMVKIENQQIEATAFIGLIESGKQVEIVDAKSNTVIVRERREKVD